MSTYQVTATITAGSGADDAALMDLAEEVYEAVTAMVPTVLGPIVSVDPLEGSISCLATVATDSVEHASERAIAMARAMEDVRGGFRFNRVTTERADDEVLAAR